MNNVLIVFNYNAGRKKAIKYKKQIQKFLLKKGVNFKFIDVNKVLDFDCEVYDTILVVGGDGTVNKILPLLINTDKKLGIIPCGTANLLAERLGINTLSEALKIIDRGDFTKIDLMSINNHLSILRCGIGYDADIICKTPQTLKNKFGYFAYFLAGILFALRLKIKTYSIKINNIERDVKASCVIIANAGNMYKNMFSIAKSSKLNDGLFDIFILKTKNPILFFIEFIKILLNIKLNSPFSEFLQGNSLKIKNNYCLAHIDGEKVKFTEDLHLGIIQRSINIYCKEDILYKN